jgi:hypothetical protein
MYSQAIIQEEPIMSITQGAEAFESGNNKEVQNAGADFGHPLLELGRPSEGSLNGLDHNATALADSVMNMRTSLMKIANSPDAAQFADFFAYCRQQCAAGEPAYKLLFGEKI